MMRAPSRRFRKDVVHQLLARLRVMPLDKEQHEEYHKRASRRRQQHIHPPLFVERRKPVYAEQYERKRKRGNEDHLRPFHGGVTHRPFWPVRAAALAIRRVAGPPAAAPARGTG